jgi:hypothetical protein
MHKRLTFTYYTHTDLLKLLYYIFDKTNAELRGLSA